MNSMIVLRDTRSAFLRWEPNFKILFNILIRVSYIKVLSALAFPAFGESYRRYVSFSVQTVSLDILRVNHLSLSMYALRRSY